MKKQVWAKPTKCWVWWWRGNEGYRRRVPETAIRLNKRGLGGYGNMRSSADTIYISLMTCPPEGQPNSVFLDTTRRVARRNGHTAHSRPRLQLCSGISNKGTLLVNHFAKAEDAIRKRVNYRYWAEMYAGRVACCPWGVTVSMPTGQTDRQTDGRTPDRYITRSAGRGHWPAW